TVDLKRLRCRLPASNGPPQERGGNEWKQARHPVLYESHMMGDIESEPAMEPLDDRVDGELPEVVVESSPARAALPPPAPPWQVVVNHVQTRDRISGEFRLDNKSVVRPRDRPDVVASRRLDSEVPTDAGFRALPGLAGVG